MRHRVFFLLALFLILVPSATAQDDETLVIHINANVQGYNSILSQTSVSNFVSSFIWPTLYQSDPQTGEILPGLTSWTISEDGLTYTFNVQEDAVWSDGVPITANDIRFTLEALKSPVVGSFLGGGINYESLNVVDDKTLEVVLPEVDCSFLGNLWFGIMPAHRFAPDFSDFAEGQLTTAPDIAGGPYILEEQAADQFIRLRANPNYWQGVPNIDTLIFRIIPDFEVAFQSLQTGDVDVLGALTEEQLPVAQENPNLVVETLPTNTIVFLAMNHGDPANPQPGQDEEGNLIEQAPHPIFGDVRVRRAIAMGYDKEAIITVAGEGTVRTTAPFSPTIQWAYDSDIAPLPYDPEEAARLLDEAGWVLNESTGVREKDGVPLEFQLDYVGGSTVNDAIVLIMQDQLGQIGVRVNPSSGETQSQIGNRLLPQVYDTFLLTIGAGSIVDPNFSSNVILYSGQDIPNAGLNVASYVSERADELVVQGRSVPGCAVEDRAPIYHELQALTQEDVIYDLLFTPVARFAYSSRIQGIDPGPWSIYYNIHEWTLGE